MQTNGTAYHEYYETLIYLRIYLALERKAKKKNSLILIIFFFEGGGDSQIVTFCFSLLISPKIQ